MRGALRGSSFCLTVPRAPCFSLQKRHNDPMGNTRLASPPGRFHARLFATGTFPPCVEQLIVERYGARFASSFLTNPHLQHRVPGLYPFVPTELLSQVVRDGPYAVVTAILDSPPAPSPDLDQAAHSIVRTWNLPEADQLRLAALNLSSETTIQLAMGRYLIPAAIEILFEHIGYDSALHNTGRLVAPPHPVRLSAVRSKSPRFLGITIEKSPAVAPDDLFDLSGLLANVLGSGEDPRSLAVWEAFLILSYDNSQASITEIYHVACILASQMTISAPI
jgi:hypothetical protein